jgi:hypothetical protein
MTSDYSEQTDVSAQSDVAAAEPVSGGGQSTAATRANLRTMNDAGGAAALNPALCQEGATPIGGLGRWPT